MLYSPVFTTIVLKTALVIAAIEWTQSGASPLGLVAWLLPCIGLVDSALDQWPGRYICLETLWIVLVYSDSAQLVIGRQFGRTPAVPSISPNKSLEGYIGGIAIAYLVATFGHGWMSIPTLVTLIAGVVGDLYFSYFKRRAGVKDFSNLLGPHGGLCDRIDSFVFAILSLYAWGVFAGTEQQLEFLSMRAL